MTMWRRKIRRLKEMLIEFTLIVDAGATRGRLSICENVISSPVESLSWTPCSALGTDLFDGYER